ncbi:MAG: Uncharacterized protein Athens101410_468 [Parcubacteria group bacterium Athens1014_10]|nr:MAG: Uncharacterized protein Athens101410_468 [Parcubacteria group bacterium Athens1014_10]TSD05223.1 MAG: Uncharacterized protein Athens071412_421 [Parcubacteria group bacterium Athens0714_12]
MEIKNKFKNFLVANFGLFSFIIPLVLLSFSYFYLLAPKYAYLKEIGGLTLQSLKEAVLTKGEYLSNLKELKEVYNRLSDDEKERLKQILPKNKDITNLFIHFENLVEKNGLELGGINFTDLKSEGKIKILNIKLSLKGGNYQIFKKFLQNLEKDVKILDVNSVNFSVDGYDLSINTYYLEDSSGQ